jgi:hypothetical protein
MEEFLIPKKKVISKIKKKKPFFHFQTSSFSKRWKVCFNACPEASILLENNALGHAKICYFYLIILSPFLIKEQKWESYFLICSTERAEMLSHQYSSKITMILLPICLKNRGTEGF